MPPTGMSSMPPTRCAIRIWGRVEVAPLHVRQAGQHLDSASCLCLADHLSPQTLPSDYS